MATDPSSEPSNPIWGPDWPEVRHQWILDPDVIFLNHGSFGACPEPVLQRQSELRHQMEAQPVEFLWRRLPGLFGEVREQVAAFLRADPSGIVFVPNATTGVNTVLASMDFRRGDRIVATDHAYPAVLNAMRRTCAQAGAELTVQALPFPLPEPDALAAALLEAVNERTRLVVIDHVTSPTAAIFPVERVVAACRDRGVRVLVDAAHAPGMIDIDLEGLQPDFWTGNFHKWVCAPKGAAALLVAPEHRRSVRPLVTSHGYGRGLAAEFDWPGTSDPTAVLSVPAALSFLEGLGWERLRTHNHELAAHGQRVVADALRTEPPVDERRFGSMAVVELPLGTVADEAAAVELQARMYEDDRIEVPVYWWKGRALVRVSAQAYNHPGQYIQLAGSLARLVGSGA